MIRGTLAGIIYGATGIIIYLFCAYCLREIARKRALPHPWFAWIPILDVYVYCRAATKKTGRAVIWTVLCLLPIVDLVFIAIISVKLARVLHRNRWYGLLLVIPIVDFVVIWDLAFGIRRTWQAAAA